MKLLLTSGGITNKSIARSLRKLLGKPFNKSKLVFIPTAANISPEDKQWLINDLNNVQKLGFKEVGILNIDATPSEKVWRPRLEKADVILFGGGNTYYLLRWLKQSGLGKALPKLLKSRVYVGISAGSIVAAPTLKLSSRTSRDFFKKFYRGEPEESPVIEEGLGLVNFHVRPHLNSPGFTDSKKKYLAKVAKEVDEPIYAIDDDSAVEVADGKIRMISEGKYVVFND